MLQESLCIQFWDRDSLVDGPIRCLLCSLEDEFPFRMEFVRLLSALAEGVWPAECVWVMSIIYEYFFDVSRIAVFIFFFWSKWDYWAVTFALCEDSLLKLEHTLASVILRVKKGSKVWADKDNVVSVDFPPPFLSSALFFFTFLPPFCFPNYLLW